MADNLNIQGCSEESNVDRVTLSSIVNGHESRSTLGVLNHHVNSIVARQDDVLNVVDITKYINLTYHTIALIIRVTLGLNECTSRSEGKILEGTAHALTRIQRDNGSWYCSRVHRPIS